MNDELELVPLGDEKVCQSCQQQFEVTPDDMVFYQKMAVPAPTLCPRCRLQRRFSWRNEWRLFRKPDAKTGQEIFSSFPPSSPVKIYDTPDWFSDSWDPLDYGREYDWNRSFFEQLRELMQVVPLPSRGVTELENSDYAINASWLKNCYLVMAANYTEDSAYVIWDNRSRNTFDCHMTNGCELCYGSVNLTNCYQTFYSVDCDGCRNVVLSKDLIGCSNCFGCVNLRNKEFYIFNEQYTQVEYEQKLKAFQLNTHAGLTELTKQAYAFWLTQPHKYMHGNSNIDVSGDYAYESKNAQSVFRTRGLEDAKWCQNILEGPCLDCYDYTNWGHGAELIYDSIFCGDGAYNIKFSWYCWSNVRNLQYSMFCLNNASDLFGCVGLRGKQYCILNKQYTKEEYEALVPKIIEQMNALPFIDSNGRMYRYGEFFPSELSPLEYNITDAQEFFPLTQAIAIEQGYRWLERPPRKHPIQHTADQLPEVATDADERLIGQAIECAHKGTCSQECTLAYQILPQELAFLIEQQLPLPRLCPNCRHYERIAQRSQIELHHRQCMCDKTDHSHQGRCSNEFETTYSPDRPEIVYCEDCYQKEVS